MRFKNRKPLKNRRNDDTLVLSKGENGEWTPHDLRRTAATGAPVMQRRRKRPMLAYRSATKPSLIAEAPGRCQGFG